VLRRQQRKALLDLEEPVFHGQQALICARVDVGEVGLYLAHADVVANGEGLESTQKFSLGVANKFMHLFQDLGLATGDSLDDTVFEGVKIRVKFCSGYWLMAICFWHTIPVPA
jgi:hypothetical protein